MANAFWNFFAFFILPTVYKDRHTMNPFRENFEKVVEYIYPSSEVGLLEEYLADCDHDDDASKGDGTRNDAIKINHIFFTNVYQLSY